MSKSNAAINQFINQLKASAFFCSMDEASLTTMAERAKQTNYQAGELIFDEGEPSKGLYWLESGTIKAVKYSQAGKEQILHFIKPGQTFNEVGAFTTRPNPASVVALEEVKAWCIPREAIKERIYADPGFAQMIIDVLSDRLRHSVMLIEDLSLRPVVSRVARLILDESDDGTLFRPTWYTQYELASRLGTVADVVQRSLRKLEADNLIEVERKQIQILNRPELEKMAA
ncbi:MAG: CRP-like cAMP-binding protein [Cellvibrionaceae bacterium]|jgi:CRP-like cAMP-binding protein